ncbi:HEAT repeat domain-containing protein [Leptothoe spongobia]|uniref:HEAT repeat domain-containing protein n=1 Tax=Leptothoe spongobia TAU-MAC 1115 TaxID=1967444 RepID=A0A947GPN7_9CYAN|nr:HEAT repeat domain-containing protein [Leptothoe spongobia]MBT9316646.1 HEAT repeat domain-containing protein [Leptothoe spongobia TAU-MAC 1115]
MRQVRIGLVLTVLVLSCSARSNRAQYADPPQNPSIPETLTPETSALEEIDPNPSDNKHLTMNLQNASNLSMFQLQERLYSSDQTVSGLALGELIRRGEQATPVLLEALTHENPRTRRLAAEGLQEIADPASADALFQATQDINGEVRARAAIALYTLGDDRGLEALVANLNDYPDILHSPYTASMYPLMKGGQEVLPLIVPLLRSEDQLTRERAFLIVEAVATRLPEVENWENLWRSLGSYSPTAPQTERDTAAQQWENWLEQL